MVNIAITNLQRKIPLSRKKIQTIVKLVLLSEGGPNKGDVSLIVTTDSRIRKLNKRFLNEDRATDVLAFSFSEGKFSKISRLFLLGDIAVSSDTAITNARLYKTTPRKELYLYIIHGLLHLLGYDDTTKQKRAVMRKKEKYYLQKCTSAPVHRSTS